MTENNRPTILACAAHDPSGAAGIQADIESINQNGGHCISVLTALSAQNTDTFTTILPQSPESFRHQADLLLSDIVMDAVKIGLIGDKCLIGEIATIIREYPGIPVVLDPVLRSGSGTELGDNEIIDGLLKGLIPLTTVLTPNHNEALALTGMTDPDAAADRLMMAGCRAVLITGADMSTPNVINKLYQQHSGPLRFEWERLPHVYHGSGCTLAAALVTQLAMGRDIVTAAELAQDYTWKALQQAVRLGHSQWHPGRHN